MKTYLLPQDGKFYKANLHAHSTVSDGGLTPAEMKAAYQKMGYSIIAFTDHDVLVPHQELTDDRFLALNGYEMAVFEEGHHDRYHLKTCHFCLIALEPDNLMQVCTNHRIFQLDDVKKNNGLFLYDKTAESYNDSYTPQCVSHMMMTARERGFFVTYNHPTWSGEGYEQYSRYDGMHAMEICNFTCKLEGHDEYNPRVYDDLLRAGKRIFCIATDDNHNGGGSLRDSGGAWTMIKAASLDYRTVTRALEQGWFYASNGPEIRELWVEDGVIQVATSAAACIRFTFGDRRAVVAYGEPGQPIFGASAKLPPYAGYVRVTVEDAQGRWANSNAYFLDML